MVRVVKLLHKWGVVATVTTFTVFSVQFALPIPADAQSRFFTQSSSRGLQNARLDARMSTAENNITNLQASSTEIFGDMATLETTAACSAGDVLYHTGGAWACRSETDPTVSAFAKSDLPTCGAGQVLAVTGTGPSASLSCVDNAGASIEIDPTVTAFAKEDVDDCAADEILTMTSGSLVCTTGSGFLSANETDPTVEAFAKSSLPTCSTGEVLRSNGSSLSCVADVGGSGAALGLNSLSDVVITTAADSQILQFNGSNWVNSAEDDPSVYAFAKTVLPNCASGEVLTGDGTDLSCTPASSAIASVDWGKLINVPQPIIDVSGATTTDGNFLVGDGSNFVTESGATARTSLGLGTAAVADLIDEDNMVSNSATALPSQQSVKAYVDAQIGTTFDGDWSSLSNIPATVTDIENATPTDGNFLVGNGTDFITESGVTARTSLGLGSAAIAGLIDDDTLATASASNIASAESVKAYVDNEISSVSGSIFDGAYSSLTGIPNAIDAIDGLTPANDRLAYYTGASSAALTTFTAAGRALIDDANAAAQRTTLGLVIGTNVQAYDAQLADIAGLTPTDSNIIVGDGANFVLESGATARTSLGLGSAAVATLIDDDTLGTASASNIASAESVKAYVDAEIGTVSGAAFDGDFGSLTGVPQPVQDVSDATATDGNFLVGDGSNFVMESGATARTSLGLGTAATSAATDFLAVANNLSDLNNAATARTNLGLVIGTNVQAYDADLTTFGDNPLTAAELGQLQNIDTATISTTQWGYLGATNQGLATTDDVTFNSISGDGSGLTGITASGVAWAGLTGVPTSIVSVSDTTVTAAGLAILDDADAAAQRTTLGLGSAAIANLIDEDNMASDSAVAVPSQQSVKAYVDAEIATVTGAAFDGAYGSLTGVPQPVQDVSNATATDGNFLVGDGSNFVTESGATARTSLGLGSAAVATLIDDDTLGTATASNIASAESIKAYVDAEIGTVSGAAFDGAFGSLTGVPTPVSDVSDATATDGNFLVGNGTNFVTESGATARTSLELGAGDSPSFGGLNIDSNTLLVDSVNDRVGIGNNSPATALDVSGTVTATAFSGDGSGLTGVSASSGSFGDGSAAAPSIAFSADTDTGIYRSGADTLGIATGGTEAISVADNGYVTFAQNIGVAGAAPGASYGINSGNSIALSGANALNRSGTELILASSPTFDQVSIETGGTERMRVEADGDVAIGKTTAATALDVSGTVTATAFSGDGSGLTGVTADSVGISGTAGQVLFNSDGSTLAHTSNVYWDETNDRLGIGTNTPGAQLHLNDDGASVVLRIQSDNDQFGHIDFVNDDGTDFHVGQRSTSGDLFGLVAGTGPANNTGLILNQSGQVGILMIPTGSYELEVAGAVSATSFAGDGASLTNVTATDFTLTGDDGQILFNNANAVTHASNLYWDETNDRLGVGTASPAEAMDVSGTVRATGFTIGNVNREAFGSGATVGGNYSLAIGGNAETGSINSATAVGFAASATTAGSTAVGAEAGAHGNTSIALGNAAVVTSGSNGSIAIGSNALVSAMGGTAVGVGAQVTDRRATAIGNGAVASGDESIAIGVGSIAQNDDSIVIAARNGSTDSNRQFVVGSDDSPVENMFIGEGVSSSTPRTSIAINATGGDGTNIAATDLILAGGQATGNAAGGDILFQTSNAGSSGTAQQSLTTKMAIAASGNVGIGTTAPSTELEVAGTVSATAFSGDGSGLTGVSADSVGISGTAGQVLFNSDGSTLAHASNIYWDETNDRLGINNSSPDYDLDVSGLARIARSSPILYLKDTDNTTAQVAMASTISFRDSADAEAAWFGFGSGSSNDLAIRNNLSSSFIIFNAGSEAMRIDSSGNVGVGTGSPNATLDVSGTIQVAGTGSESCTSDHYGMIRYNSATGKMQICRP